MTGFPHCAPEAPPRCGWRPAGAEPGDGRFCPHCGGALARHPRLFEHPCFDDAAHSIRPEWGRPRRLTPGQWAMLCALRAAFGRCAGRDYLIARRGPITKVDDPDPAYIHVLICALRQHLRGTPFVILTEYGLGYRLTWREPQGRQIL